jgi:DNA repair exonuclease SbcCD ATPase subunit
MDASRLLAERNSTVRERDLAEANARLTRRCEQQDEIIRQLRQQLSESQQQQPKSGVGTVANRQPQQVGAWSAQQTNINTASVQQQLQLRLTQMEADNERLRHDLELTKRRLEESERSRLAQDEQVTKQRQVYEADISLLNTQLNVFQEDFDTEKQQRLRTEAQLTELQAELALTQQQLRQYNLQQMQNIHQRREAALAQHRMQYERTAAALAPRPTAAVGRSPYQSDGLHSDVDEDGEDEIDGRITSATAAVGARTS